MAEMRELTMEEIDQVGGAWGGYLARWAIGAVGSGIFFETVKLALTPMGGYMAEGIEDWSKRYGDMMEAHFEMGGTLSSWKNG